MRSLNRASGQKVEKLVTVLTDLLGERAGRYVLPLDRNLERFRKAILDDECRASCARILKKCWH